MSLSTSFAISGAVNDAMMDNSVRFTAGALMDMYLELSQEEFQEFLFQYSANLVSVTASLVTEIFLTKEQIEEMMTEALELKNLSDEIIE